MSPKKFLKKDGKGKQDNPYYNQNERVDIDDINDFKMNNRYDDEE